MNDINAKYIKACLMSYYRFYRGYLCVDECNCCGISDILVDTGKAIYDIEIKISKSDLINGEAKKYKHWHFKNGTLLKNIPNKFYMCVPKYLEDTAKQWVEDTNTKYGIIIYNHTTFKHSKDFIDRFNIIKNAKFLTKEYSSKYTQLIAKRLNSALINKLQKEIITNDNS